MLTAHIQFMYRIRTVEYSHKPFVLFTLSFYLYNALYTYINNTFTQNKIQCSIEPIKTVKLCNSFY